jgi:tRNA U38,U39,U40 pseudouridine synthase TruA
MVGALLEVGLGEREVDDLKNLIENPRPGAPIRTAPAHGLCLEHVYYRSCPAVTRVQESKKSSARSP